MNYTSLVGLLVENYVPVGFLIVRAFDPGDSSSNFPLAHGGKLINKRLFDIISHISHLHKTRMLVRGLLMNLLNCLSSLTLFPCVTQLTWFATLLIWGIKELVLISSLTFTVMELVLLQGILNFHPHCSTYFGF